MSPVAADTPEKSPLISSSLTAAVPRQPASIPRSPKASMGPPPRTFCALNPCPSRRPRASSANPPLTQCTSASIASLKRALGCSCHSSAPALRELNVIVPAEPCHRLPEKSWALTEAGRKRLSSEAGRVATTTAAIAMTPMRTKGQNARARSGGAAVLGPRLRERDTGIDHSRAGRAIHRDRLDREAVARIQRGEPGNHRIEGRCLELHAYSRTGAGLCAAQRRGEPRFAADAVDQRHGRLAGGRRQSCAAGLNLRCVEAHPRQILFAGFAAIHRLRHRRVHRPEYSPDENHHADGHGADEDHALLTG